MDTIQNMRAFLMTAREGNFSKAARLIGVAPSVLTKRVQQLEWQLKSQLLHRTTRHVALTEDGERHLESVRQIVTAYDELAAGVMKSPKAIEGHLRVKAPAAATERLLGRIFLEFQNDHPGVTLEVTVRDRTISPIEEGFDISLAVLPASFDGVVEEQLASYPRVACAAPSYLARKGSPETPHDLAHHDCMIFLPSGSNWTFGSDLGPIGVNVRAIFSTNDAQLLVDYVAAGHGIAVLSRLVAGPALKSGALVPILADYPSPDLSLKAMVPKSRFHLARVQALLARIRESLADIPPWEELGARAA